MQPDRVALIRPGGCWAPRLILPVLLGSLGCATARPAPPVDLAAARAAVTKARESGAPEAAKEPYERAVSHLKEAETLASSPDSGAAVRARCLGERAVAEAEWAAALAAAAAQAASPGPTARPPEVERLTTKLKRSEEEQRRLEDRLALVQHDLDLTETEVIRTKARLKGIETKAEASSAIAEARILVGRLADRGHTVLLTRCQESLAKAEELLRDENYGAAIFFAEKVQDMVAKGGAPTPPTPADDPPAPWASVVVTAAKVNIRGAPSLQAAVLGQAPQGASLQTQALHGEWIRVKYGSLTGWVHGSFVQPGAVP